MESPHFDSVLAYIPLDETINIIMEKFFSEKKTVHSFNKNQFECFLTLATKEYYFLFDGELYQQVYSAAISPLVPILANVFLCHIRIFGYVIVH